MSVNKVILVGRVGKDPETRYMSNGDAATNLSLATTENWKDKSGERQEKTEWHNIATFRRLAEIAGEYLKKGSLIYVEGKLATRKWQDKEGNDRYTTEVIAHELKMLSGKKTDNDSSDDAAPAAPAASPAPAKNRSAPAKKAFDDFDESLPF